jgi:cold shock CspA family protein
MDGQLVRIYKDLAYGFIKADGKDYFFHRSDFDGDWDSLCRDHMTGSEIHLDFEPRKTDKGLRAEEVTLSDV